MKSERLIIIEKEGEHGNLQVSDILGSSYIRATEIDNYESIPKLIKWLQKANADGYTHIEIKNYSDEEISTQFIRLHIETQEEANYREHKEEEERERRMALDEKKEEAKEWNEYNRLKLKYESK